MSCQTANLLDSEFHKTSNNRIQVLMLMELLTSPAPLPQNEVHLRHFSLGILSALKYLHESLGFIHMDIKLQNILFQPQYGNYVLCDFGSCMKPILEISDNAQKSTNSNDKRIS